jgi:hypothetical protein
MCARFHWFLESGFKLNFSDDENACKFFGWLPINANIYISSDGAEKFSIGLGLLIWALISIAVILASLSFSMQEIESADNVNQKTTKTVWTLIAIHFISTLLCCQQSCVLLPLTSISMNPCVLNVPTDPIKAVCYHKWAVMAIPYGIPMVLGAGVGLAVAGGLASLRSPPLSIAAMVCAGAAAMLLLTALGFFIFWIYGGFAIGVWFTFGSINVLIDLALVKILVGPSIVLLDAISTYVSRTFGSESAGCCAVLIICPSFLEKISSKRLKYYLLHNCLGSRRFAHSTNESPDDSLRQLEALEPEMVRPSLPC